MAPLITYKTDVVPNYLDSIEPHSDFQFHFHNIYEIYYFIDGDADYIVEGKQYPLVPNSILLLAPNAVHGVRINNPTRYKRFTIHFNADLISIDRRTYLLSAFPDSTDSQYHSVYYQDVGNFNLYPFFKALTDCNKLPQSIAKKLMPVYIEALLAQLVVMCNTLNKSDDSIVLSNTVVEITDYINQNISKPITLDSLCDHFFISKVHLNRIFRNSIGTTVFDYIAYKRIGIAQHLLGSGVPAKEAAAQVGYNDYSTFFRAYKKITGHSPTQDAITK